MSSKTDKVSNFITSLVMHFPVRHESTEREMEWLQAMNRTLRDYDASTLAKASAFLIETRRDRRFPLPAECRDACAEAIKRERAEMPVGLPLDKKFPEWSHSRMTFADDCLKTQMARRAANENWILSFWNFCRGTMRMPETSQEIGKCIADAKGFDQAYANCVRGECGELSRSLVRLGDSMLQRREELRAKVLGSSK